MLHLIITLGVIGTPPAASDVQQAVTTPQNSAPIVVQGTTDPEKRILCIRDTPTGSILSKRVCNTQTRWEELRRQGDKLAEQIMRYQIMQQATSMYRDGRP
jgi:hypothetical protein